MKDNLDDGDPVQVCLSQIPHSELDVQCVPCSSTAISMLKHEYVDAVLLDLGLQNSAGLETLTAVVEAAPKQPVIVLTGQDSRQIGLDSIHRGAQDYLPKGDLTSELLFRTILYSIERKRLQDELQRHRDLLDTILNNIPVMVAYLDKNGSHKYVNRSWQETLGWSLEEASSRDILAELYPDPNYRQFVGNYIAAAEGRWGNFDTTKRDGSVISTTWINAPLAEGATIGIGLDITQRKTLDKALEETERRYRDLWEKAPVMMISLDRQGRIEFASDRFCEELGYTRNELLGRTPFEFQTEDSAQYAQSVVFQQFLETGMVKDAPLRFVRKNAEIIDLLLSVTAERDAAGNIVRSRSVFADVTHRKRAEHALRESEERFRLMADAITDVLWMADSGINTIQYVSPAYETVWGRSLSSLYEAPRSFLDAIHDEDRDRVTEALLHGLSGQPFQYEYRIVRPDGDIRWILDRGFPVMNENGQVNGYTGIAQDITERKKAEEELRIRDTAIMNSINGISFASPEGNIFYSNLAMAKMWGFDGPNEVLGAKPGDLFDNKEVFSQEFQVFREQGYYSGELTARRKDGSTFDVQISASTVFGQNGEPVVIMASFVDITDRKSAEAACMASEARYRSVVSTAGSGIILQKRSGEIVTWNPEAERIFGISSEEALGQTLVAHNWKAFKEDGSALPGPEMPSMHTLATGQPVTNQRVKIVRPSGDAVWASVNTSPIFEAGQSLPTAVVMTLTDVTERRKTEEALKASEERLRLFIEHAPAALAMFDREMRYLAASRRWMTDYHLSEAQVIHRSHYEVFPEIPDRWKTAHRRGMQGEIVKAEEDLFERIDGHAQRLRWEVRPWHTAEGGIGGIVIFTEDVTEQRKLQELESMLATAVEQGADAVLVTDTKGNIEYVNPAFEETTGYSREEVLGSNPRILKSGAHKESFYRDMWKTITSGNNWRGRLVNRRKDGTKMTCESVIAPVMDETGVIVRYVAVLRDVTESESLHQRLVQSQKMEAIGTLAGGIAHDFNNILFAMTGYTELAMDSLEEETDIYVDLKKVVAAGKRAGDMVKQILTFSRQAQPERSPIELAPIVKEGLKFLRASIPSTIEIKHNIQPNLGKIYADATQMHQILMNFCTNSAHAMRDTKGVLSVELTGASIDQIEAAEYAGLLPGKYVRLTVGDTGHGIPREMLDRIFEPYFTTKKAGEGTGLGLSVVHGIVKSHGGAITVNSEVNKGTSFHVYLPVIENEPDQKQGAAIDVVPTGDESILLVDDEQILVEMGQSILGRLGYQVTTIMNPLEALELFRTDPQRFDLVITDLTMPKMTGDELSWEMKRIRPDVRVILCTGFSEGLSEKRLEEVGISVLIKKPILKKNVAQVVRQVLDQGK